jgi:ferredoxin
MSGSLVTIRIEDLGRLVEAVGRAATLYAPVARGHGPELAPIAPGEAGSILLEYSNTIGSVKPVFFPQREVLLSYQGDALRAVHLPRERIVVFGARPCDARALALLDRVFGASTDPQGRFPDPYYLRRRERSLVIALACAEPQASCFCTAVGGHPAGREGADLLAFRLVDRLLFEAVTGKGEAFLAEHAGLFGPAGLEEDSARESQVQRAESLLPGPEAAAAFEPRRLAEILDRNLEHPVWEEAARGCLGCGACAYLCPTCHCFDITDETDGRGCGIRLRTWDCCQYPLFTRHASGHNPRDSRRQRMRQRIMHKFSYTLANQGAQFCVGCGRCVRSCPVNLDIRGILATLAGLG